MLAGRVAFGPKVGENQLHFGAAANWQDSPNSDNEWRIRTRPESHQTSVRLVDTGTIAEVNSITTFGAEAAWVRGPFSIQGEFMQQSVDRDGGSDPDFTGWYAYASWFVTGDVSRAYKKGSFGRTKATNAWELAVRYSNIDLDDSGINGGKENNITAAVNYYVNPYLRFMLNGVFIDAQDTPVLGGTEDDKPTAIISPRCDGLQVGPDDLAIIDVSGPGQKLGPFLFAYRHLSTVLCFNTCRNERCHPTG